MTVATMTTAAVPSSAGGESRIWNRKSDAKLVTRAMEALLKHHKTSTNAKNKQSLVGDHKSVQVQFCLARVPGNASPKPIRLEIPHPLHFIPGHSSTSDTFDEEGVEEPSICIFVKEESKPAMQEFIGALQQEKHLSCVKKIMGLQSLRKKHGSFQQRRDLLHRYDLFLADDRILPMLAKALGKNFFETKKQPIPINLKRKKSLPFQILKCMQATHMYLSSGTAVTIRAGNTGMPVDNLIDNVNSICEYAPLKIPGKWSNVRSISIKLPDSVALPIYNRVPEELAQISHMAGLDDRDDSATKKRKAAAAAEEHIDDAKRTKTEEAQTEEDEKKNKKKKKEKSPLVRALLKAKENEKEEKAIKDDDDDNDDAVVLKTPVKNDDGADKGHTTSSSKKTKKTKKRKTSIGGDENGEEEASTPKTPAKKEEANEVAAATVSSKKKKQKTKSAEKAKQEEAVVAPETPATKKEITKTSLKKKKHNAATKNDEKAESPEEIETPSFMASKKFAGAKKGYVFKKGHKGVGYYVDEKPLPNKMLLEALTPTRLSISHRGQGAKRSKKKRKSW